MIKAISHELQWYQCGPLNNIFIKKLTYNESTFVIATYCLAITNGYVCDLNSFRSELNAQKNRLGAPETKVCFADDGNFDGYLDGRLITTVRCGFL